MYKRQRLTFITYRYTFSVFTTDHVLYLFYVAHIVISPSLFVNHFLNCAGVPTVIFFSAITSILFYFGIIQKVVSFFAKVYTKFLKISGSESLSVIGNIFLGQTEAPLLIKAYLPKMNKSEILLVMIGGMATVAGGVLAAYIAFLGGDDPVKQVEFAKHLLTASVMAAPGAILISKIIIPQTDEISSDVNISDYDSGSNILDAISNGTIEGIKLAVNIGAMVIVFIALIAMVNYMLFFVGDISGLNSITVSYTHLTLPTNREV